MLDIGAAPGETGGAGVALCQEIFHVPVDEIEAKVEPGGLGDDIGRESVGFADIH